jgi:hypothetical protein
MIPGGFGTNRNVATDGAAKYNVTNVPWFENVDNGSFFKYQNRRHFGTFSKNGLPTYSVSHCEVFSYATYCKLCFIYVMLPAWNCQSILTASSVIAFLVWQMVSICFVCGYVRLTQSIRLV